MKLAARYFISLSIFLIVANDVSAGRGGGADTGGGDPRVAEFLAASKSICRWMSASTELRSYSEKCDAEVADLEASVNSGVRLARISSTHEELRAGGVPKDAITNLKERTVEIQIERWQLETLLEHQMTAAMELSLLLDIPNRYNVGQMVLGDAGAPVLGFMGRPIIDYSASNIPKIPDRGTVICKIEPEFATKPPPIITLDEHNNFEWSDYVDKTQIVLMMQGNLDVMILGRDQKFDVRGIRIAPADDTLMGPMARLLLKTESLKIYCAIGN